MKIKKYALQKALSLSLVGCSVLSVATPALATAIDVAGGSADVPVVVTAEAARFSVTAPTTLPISVDADGVVTVANDVNVINNSHGSVIVSDLSITGTNGWNVVNYDTNMAKEKVNDTKIAVDINGNESNDGGIDFTAGSFTTMAGDTGTDANKAPVTYDAKLPAQATALTDVSAVNAVFTVDWNTGEDSDSDTQTPPDNNSSDLETPPSVDDDYIETMFQTTATPGGLIVEGTEESNAAESLIIPSEIGGVPVVGVADGGFADSSASNVVIPESVTDIGANSFNPDSVTTVTIYTDNGTTPDLVGTGLENATINVQLVEGIESERTTLTGPEINVLISSLGDPTSIIADTAINTADASTEVIDISALSNGTTIMFIDSSGALRIQSDGKIEINRNASSMFNSLYYVTTANLENFDMSNVISMNSMFNTCSFMTSLSISSWDISNVVNMNMFLKKTLRLVSVDMSSWDTSNVTSMAELFYQMAYFGGGVTDIGIKNWDCSKVLYFTEMFYQSRFQGEVNLSGWNTQSNLDSTYMFGAMTASKLNIDNFKFGKCSSYMFSSLSSSCELSMLDCVALYDSSLISLFYDARHKELDLDSWDISKATSLNRMFYNCSSLTSLHIDNWDVSNITEWGNFLYSTSALTELDVSSWAPSTFPRLSDFTQSSGLTRLWVSNAEFYDNLGIPVGTTNALKVRISSDDEDYFNPATSGMYINSIISGYDAPKSVVIERGIDVFLPYTDVIDISYDKDGSVVMYMDYFKTIHIQADGWFAPYSLDTMFKNITTITSIDLSNLSPMFITTAAEMFYGCSNLTSVTGAVGLPSGFGGAITDASSMFYACQSLVNVDVSWLDASSLLNAYGMFYGCYSLTSINMGDFVAPKLTSTRYMFYGCRYVTTLDLRNLVIGSVSSTSSMFDNCSGLTVTVDASQLASYEALGYSIDKVSFVSDQ